MLTKLLRNESGFALPTAMMVMIVLTLLGTALWQYSITDTKQVAMDQNKMQAHYIARAGAEAMAEHLINKPGTTGDIISGTQNNPAIGTLENGTFEVTVTKDAGEPVTISATGYVNSDIKDTVTLTLEPLSAPYIFDNVIFSHGDLDVTKMKEIVGDLESAGDIDAPSDYPHDVVEDSDKVFAGPVFPTDLNDKTFTIGTAITESGNYGNININSNEGDLVFDTGGNELHVMVDTISIKDDILILGEGKVYLYIKYSATFDTPNIYNNDANKFFIFLQDSCTFDVQANGVFNAFIYGPGADVILQSGNTEFHGSIIANLVVKNDPDGEDEGLPSNASVIYSQVNDVDVGSIIIAYEKGRWN
ncbi:MAG TPA: hypothetical protein DEF34_01430 [Desulfotomaculum sp.]|nr:MAG: hypothetical protein JL56_17155 [Desulfotomaculum sp. BICA1-6]HBX22287.1 hypothetical protein [Desulfotomaculum sp.]